MAWRTAKALDQLLAQVNALAPFRSKKADGAIGDEAHATRSSDHNPWVKDGAIGVVTARDFTHDPANGFDAYKFAEGLKTNADNRLKYIISNKRIWNPAISPDWRPYTGANAHSQHTHVSVRPQKAFYDDSRPWKLPMLPAVPLTTAPGKPAGGVSDVAASEVAGWTPRPGRALAAARYMQKLGWSDIQSAVIVAQGIWESGGNRIMDIITTALGDGGTAHGGWQWRLDRYVGRNGLLPHAFSLGRSSADLEVQLLFVDKELRTTERRAGDLLRKAKTVEEATDAFICYLRPAGTKWEAPREGHGWNSRLALAKKLLEQMT
jgi:hypothetical protein